MGQDDDENMHSHYKKDEFNNKIMITSIVALSFVITLIILLHIYARCLIRRQERRAAALRQLRLSSTVSVNHLVLPRQPRSGLDPAVIASLPIFPFKEEEAQIECSVCLSLLERDEMVRKLPNCNHTFHGQCIDTWLGSQSTCPVCRTKVEPESCDHPATGPALNGNGEVLTVVVEGSSGCETVPKVGESSSRLSSFRRILSRERSTRRVDGVFDLERQQQQQ